MNEHANTTSEHDATAHEPLSYGLLTAIWVGLMVLTVVTIAVSRIDLGFLNVAVALGVASIKAGLVIFFFMHLKYENRLIKGMVLTAFVILAIAIGFTFFDVGYRY
jgi:cytochrome c oxidase subunit 4